MTVPNDYVVNLTTWWQNDDGSFSTVYVPMVIGAELSQEEIYETAYDTAAETFLSGTWTVDKVGPTFVLADPRKSTKVYGSFGLLCGPMYERIGHLLPKV